jgi:alanyl-tRNA synthetase
VGSFNVGLTNAIKAIREKHDVPVLLLSPDTSKPKGSVTIVAQVPDAIISKGLQGKHGEKVISVANLVMIASEWAAAVAKFLGGKGGGKAGTAQGSGSDVSKVQDAVAEALRFAKSKLE